MTDGDYPGRNSPRLRKSCENTSEIQDRCCRRVQFGHRGWWRDCNASPRGAEGGSADRDFCNLRFVHGVDKLESSGAPLLSLKVRHGDSKNRVQRCNKPLEIPSRPPRRVNVRRRRGIKVDRCRTSAARPPPRWEPAPVVAGQARGALLPWPIEEGPPAASTRREAEEAQPLSQAPEAPGPDPYAYSQADPVRLLWRPWRRVGVLLRGRNCLARVHPTPQVYQPGGWVLPEAADRVSDSKGALAVT